MPLVLQPGVLYQQMKFCGNYHEQAGDAEFRHVKEKINRYLESYWRTVTMAKNHAKTYPKVGQTPLTYVNKKLTATEVVKFDAWLSDDRKAEEFINKAFYEGYKQSTGWWDEKEVFNVLMIAPQEGSVNSGKALSSKSPNWFRAMAMNVYKHFVISGGDWSNLEEGETSEG